MNEPVFENSMFTNDKHYEISIHVWVCIPDPCFSVNIYASSTVALMTF